YGVWVAGGKILVTNASAPPQLLDPAANTSEPLALDAIPYDAVASEHGERVLYRARTGGATLLDVASRATTKLPVAGELDTHAIAPDGSWLALGTKTELVVMTAAGVEITRHAGPVEMIAIAGNRRIAFSSNNKIFECVLDPTPVWTE